VILAQADKITSHLINFDRDLLIIPNVAIHFNRNINTGYSYNPAVDLQPLFSQGKEPSVKKLIAQELNCREEEIAGYDLFVYNHMSGTVLGVNNEFFSAPRIDNLMCVYGTLQGLVKEESAHAVNVFFAADNEETGSATKQGAGSIFLSDVLDRICEAVQSDRRRLLASSFMISADNAHAKHPNHPELSDPQNAPHMNGGVVIKTNAAQKYATDGISAAIFGEICRHANVPTQPFANRSDMAGGSTLGSISNTKVPLMTVDIGMAQLAMHSAYETAGVKDVDHLVNAMRAFYACDLTVEKDGCYRLSCAKRKVEESTDV
jgi:aspartyl aminopeptidase